MAHGPDVVDWGRDGASAAGGRLSNNPLRPDFDPDAVDETRLREDVADLLFSHVSNPQTWDHLGDLAPALEAAPTRQVRIDPVPQVLDDRIDFVDLPIGLGLLFDVASSDEFEHPHRRHNTDVLAFLSSRGSSVDRSLPRSSRTPSQATPSMTAARPDETPPPADDASGAASPGSKPPTPEEAKAATPEARPPSGDGEGAAAADNDGQADAPAEDGEAPAAEDGERRVYTPIDAEEASRRIRLAGPPDCLIYLCMLAASPPTLDDHCVRLYNEGMARLARIRAEDEARKRALMEAEEKECTFRPNIGEAQTKAGRGKGKGKFFDAMLDWRAQQARKLKKKYAQEDEMWEKETFVPWKMNDRSRELVEARRARDRSAARSRDLRTNAAAAEPGSEDNTPARSVSQATTAVSAGPQEPYGSSRLADKEFWEATHQPVTNEKLERVVASLQEPPQPRVRRVVSTKKKRVPKRRAATADDDGDGAASPVPMQPLDQSTAPPAAQDGDDAAAAVDDKADASADGGGTADGDTTPAEATAVPRKLVGADDDGAAESSSQAAAGDEQPQGDDDAARPSHAASEATAAGASMAETVPTTDRTDADDTHVHDHDDAAEYDDEEYEEYEEVEYEESEEVEEYDSSDFEDRIVIHDPSLSVHRQRGTDRSTSSGYGERRKSITQRMDTDIVERRRRIQQRAHQRARSMKARQYDPATGQPLFQPNSMPAAYKHGVRVELSDLTPAERKEYLDRVKKRYHVDIDVAAHIASRHEESESSKGRRSMETVVQNLLDKQQKSEARVSKMQKKETDALKGQFKPTINEHPLRTTYVPLRDRPMPRKDDPPKPTRAQRQYDEEGRRRGPRRSADEAQSAVREFHSRTEAFIAAKQKHVAKAKAKHEQEVAAECAFVPAVNAVSSILVERSRSRTLEELATYEAYEEERRAQHVYDAEEELKREQRATAAAAAAKRYQAPPPPPARTLQGAQRRPRVTSGELYSRPRVYASAEPYDDRDDTGSPHSQQRGAAAAGAAGQRHTGYTAEPLAVQPLDTDALVDELLSVGRLRAPANEPAIPMGLQAAQRRIEEAQRRQAMQARRDPDLMRVVSSGFETESDAAGGDAASPATPSAAPAALSMPGGDTSASRGDVYRGSTLPGRSLERLSELDDEALRFIRSPAPVDPRAGGSGAGAHGADAASSRVASRSVDDVLDTWKRLDSLSSRLLSVDPDAV